MIKKKIFIIVDVDWFFLSHRLPIALAAKEAGYEVTIVTHDTGDSKKILEHGLKFIEIPFTFKRDIASLWRGIRCLVKLWRLYRLESPDIVHHVTLKICILGSMAVRFSGRKMGTINAITGLGYNFTGGRNGLFQNLVIILMKIFFRGKGKHFIFQNKDDLKFFQDLGLIYNKQYDLIKGSGVDLARFAFKNIPRDHEKIKVLLPARMLYDKGILEFISAALALKNKFFGKAEFILAGDLGHENPSAISETELRNQIDGVYIRWIGFQQNIVNLLNDSNIVVLPSYREGLPKSLIDAMAVGRPIITTNVPGCRECVIDGYNGFLVPLKDVHLLSSAIYNLMEDFDLQEKMGRNSRALAEKEFGIDSVVSATIGYYNKLLLSE